MHIRPSFRPAGWALLLFILLPLLLSAQYVRHSSFGSEQQRRMQYALDDWISYLGAREFGNIAAGPKYLYFATLDGGIWRYHIYDNYWDYPYTTSNGLPDNRVEKVAYDPESGLLWAFTPDDEAVFNFASEEWLSKSEASYWPYRLSEPDNNEQRGGKEQFYGREALDNLPGIFANGDFSILTDWILMDRDFQEFPIDGYLRDRYDRLWMPVKGFGIGEAELYTQRADFYRMGLPAIEPRAIAYQGDDIWIGGIARGDGGLPGIARWPYQGPGWDYFRARFISRLPSDNVNDIAIQGDSVWFATDYGVSLYDSGNDRWSNYNLDKGLISNDVSDVEILGRYLYAATDQGISRISLLSGGVERIKERRFINLPFYRLAAQGDTLWAATFRGIYRYSDQSAEWQLVPARAAISDLEITAVGTYGDEIWFASSSGIMRLDRRSGEWESFPQIGFEIRPPYRDIQVNSAAVWVATPDGLLKFDKERRYWRLFDTSDGLLSNNCRRLLLDGDYIWIVSDAGITQFYWNNPQRSD